MKFDNLLDCFNYVSAINIIEENEVQVSYPGQERFEKIISALKEITEYCHEMPAFGVSIDELTKDDKKHGTWIELEFNRPCSHDAMSFEALLIKIEPKYYGFNLIRRNSGKYEGRCFYLSLEGNMQKLSDAI